MNSTIANLTANRNYEKVLDLLNQIAPNNADVQKQISALTTSKSTYIKELQTKWNSIAPPKISELYIRELCTNYYQEREDENESRVLRGLPRIGLVDSKNWVVKSDYIWHGWSPEDGKYFEDPILYEGPINFSKIFEPLVISDSQSGSINLIWTVEHFLRKGISMGLSASNWTTVWMALAKAHLPNQFQSLSRFVGDVDKLFYELVSSINGENEIAKLRTAMQKIHRNLVTCYRVRYSD